MRFALVTNILVLEMNELKCALKLQSPPPATYAAASHFQAELLSKVLLAGTHVQKWAVAIKLSYSPSSTLHPQVIYERQSSAGLNGLQVD